MSELIHYGVKGMKWGVRRYQNADGTLTKAGQRQLVRSIEKTGRKLSKEPSGGRWDIEDDLIENHRKIFGNISKNNKVMSTYKKKVAAEKAAEREYDRLYRDKKIWDKARKIGGDPDEKHFDLVVDSLIEDTPSLKTKRQAYSKANAEYMKEIKTHVDSVVGEYGNIELKSLVGSPTYREFTESTIETMMIRDEYRKS